MAKRFAKRNIESPWKTRIVPTGMKKKRPSQHGGKTSAPAANPATSQNANDNEDFGSPLPSSTAHSQFTLAAAAAETATGSSSSSGAAQCVIKGDFDPPDNRSGAQTAPEQAGYFGVWETFEINVEFSNTDGECHCCEYRQYVRGHIKYRAQGDTLWTSRPHELLPGIWLDDTIYHEDADASTTGNAAYGHRSGPHLGKYTQNDQLTGCKFHADDSPGFHGLPNNCIYDILYEFMGVIIDVCNSDSNVKVKYWQVPLTGP